MLGLIGPKGKSKEKFFPFISSIELTLVHLWPFSYVWLLNKPYENEVTLKGQNTPLKCCQPLELLLYIEREFRSFHTYNIGSLGQRAAKSYENEVTLRE